MTGTPDAGRRTRRILTAVAGTAVASLLGLVGSATVANACGFQPRAFAVTPTSGPAGSQVSVTGQAWQWAPNSPASLAWNAANGTTLAQTTAGGDGWFSTSVTIPDVAPGTYYLVYSSGVHTAAARVAFEVITPDAPAVASSHGVASVPRSPMGSSPAALATFQSTGSPWGSAATDGLALVALMVGVGGGLAVACGRRRRALGAAPAQMDRPQPRP